MANNELHVVFGAGPVRMAVADDLLRCGRRVRMVNRSGKVSVPEGVEVVRGDAANPTFTREVSAGMQAIPRWLRPATDNG